MFQKISRIYNKTIAIAEKEIKLELRFPFAFFTSIFIKPFLSLIPFLILYSALFGTGTSQLNSIITIILAKETDPQLYDLLILQFVQKNFFSSFNQTNYLSWLIIGTIIFSFSKNGFDAFLDRFNREKFWNTIQGTLLAPINRFLILIGYTIVVLIDSILFFIAIMAIYVFIYQISITQIIILFLISFLMLLGSGGIGLIKGAIFISTETYHTLFELAQFFILFLSCYSIPLEYFPEFLRGFILFNPFYHGIELARNIIYGQFTPLTPFSLVYILIFAISAMLIGVYLFNKIWKKFGIHGY